MCISLEALWKILTFTFCSPYCLAFAIQEDKIPPNASHSMLQYTVKYGPFQVSKTKHNHKQRGISGGVEKRKQVKQEII